MNLGKLVVKGMSYAKNHKAAFLTGAGIGGMIVGTILAVKETPKAELLLQEAQEAKAKQVAETTPEDVVINVEDIKLTPMESVKAAWKPYLPSAALVIGGALCCIYATNSQARQLAAVSSSYAVLETVATEYSQYKDKVKEVLGPDKAKEIKKEVQTDVIESTPIEKRVILDTGRGSTLCYDEFSGRYFYHDPQKLSDAASRCNERKYRVHNGVTTINDWYSEIHLPELSHIIGENYGWGPEYGLILDFTSKLDENNKPVLVVGFESDPKRI